MKFKVTGDFQTFRSSVVWEDGELDGDEGLVAAARAEAERLEGHPVSGRGDGDEVYSTADHLRNPHAARRIILSILDGESGAFEVLDGEFPPAPRYRTRLRHST